MNPKIKKVIEEIERTKAKISELQTLLPELERKRIEMENTEIIKLIRSADILPAELPAFLESLKAPKPAAPAETYPLGQFAPDVGGGYAGNDYRDDEDDLGETLASDD